MTGTRLVRFVAAPPSAVYAALLDAGAVRQWMVPDDMTSEVHELDPREGGRFRISLTYASADGVGKTSGSTDTFHGEFRRLVPDRLVEQVVAFESDDPSFHGSMTIRYELRAVDGGTEVVGTHAPLPPGVSAEDNEVGWAMSMAKLAALVE